MAIKTNRFKDRYNATRNKTSTDDIVEQLYDAVERTEEKEIAPDLTPKKEIEPNINNLEKDITIQEKTVKTTPENMIPNEQTEEVQQKSDAIVEKKKLGRPRKTNEERTLFNIKLTLSEKEMLEIASSASGKTKIDYIIDLIKADYANNQEYYDQVKARINA